MTDDPAFGISAWGPVPGNKENIEQLFIPELRLLDFPGDNNRLVQEPGWFSNKSCKMLCILPFLSGCCSKTEVFEQLY
jgi:hypothetical protein